MRSDGHDLSPVRVEFRRLLMRRAKVYGLTARAIDILVERAEMLPPAGPGRRLWTCRQ